MERASNIAKKSISIALSLCLAFTAMMYMTSEPSFALSRPGKVKISSVKSEKTAQLVVKWKKKKSSGSQVQRALDKKFKKSSKKIKVKKTKKSLTINKLKSGKKYYVRVRAFNKKGKKTKYGKWSKVKACTVHKHKYVYVLEDDAYAYYSCKCGKELSKKLETKKEDLPDTENQDKDNTDIDPVVKVPPTFSQPTNTKGKQPVTAVATNSRGQIYNYKLFYQSAATYRTRAGYIKKHQLTPEVNNFFGVSGKNYYLWKHGCSTCALTTVLRATVPELEDYDPLQVLTKVIRPVVGEAIYQANFKKTLAKQMPISLKGIDKVLTAYGVKHKFVYTYTKASAKREITNHLKEGDPVIFMLKEGLYAGSPHTMIMLGLDKNGKVIVGDSLFQKDRWGASAYGLIKYSKAGDPKSNTVANIVKYMDGSTNDISKKGLFYTKGAAGNRGYILINQIDEDNAEPDM